MTNKPESVDIRVINGFLYARKRDGTLMNILVDVPTCPVYGNLKVDHDINNIFGNRNKEIDI